MIANNTDCDSSSNMDYLMRIIILLTKGNKYSGKLVRVLFIRSLFRIIIIVPNSSISRAIEIGD